MNIPAWLKSAVPLIAVASTAWVLQDQAGQHLWPAGEENPLVAHARTYQGPRDLLLLSTVALLAAIAIWQARSTIAGTAANVLATTAGIQLGRILSDLLTSRSGLPVGHDTWFGAPDYWVIWAAGTPIALCLTGLLAAALFFPIRLLRRPRRAA